MKNTTEDSGHWIVTKRENYLKNNSSNYMGGISLDFKAKNNEFSSHRAEVKLNLGRPNSTLRVSIDSTEHSYDSRTYFFDKDFNRSTLSLETLPLPEELASHVVNAVNEVKQEIGPIIQYRDDYFRRSEPEFPLYQKAR